MPNKKKNKKNQKEKMRKRNEKREKGYDTNNPQLARLIQPGYVSGKNNKNTIIDSRFVNDAT